MRIFRGIADVRSSASHAVRFRSKRFRFFRELVEPLQRAKRGPLSLLDVGGTENYWRTMGFLDCGIEFTILNLDPFQPTHAAVKSAVGDAREMKEYGDQSFDVVYSNSVIEHVGDLSDQCRMADEIRRIARNYFVQTPNYWFPLEPHFLTPGFQWLPLSARAWLIQKTSLGHLDRVPDPHDALELVKSFRLLDQREMCSLFPDGSVWRERVAGLTKSITLYRFNSS